MEKLGNSLPSIAFELQIKAGSNERGTRGLSEMSRSLIGDAWCQFAQIYGHAWTSAHGDCDQGDAWLTGLQGISRFQVAHGFRECLAVGRERAKSGDEDWPPTLGVFREYCLGHQEPIHNLVAPPEHQWASQATIDREIAHMRRILGGG